ncbi:hypothetical protein ATO8_14107 [Roseivivax marinus]|uniref:PepSY domain-containing protein n=1 Tax=Roseivivax marinus TaxID=1379903 RepID=W4HJQ8_9RHOB|nr:PepSY domain-containing protein [Roseivivax marinus]ETW12235.1 hypothetical protein ATO8_14107 [Roseivivax marinus]UMA64744.1 PepSY domain-containing protein [Roseivivax marinus]
MKILMTSLVALALAVPMAFAQDDSDEPSQDTVDAIMTMLTDMSCEMDPDDIEVEDEGGYDLDDVICQGEGQMDIELDADLNIVERRME